MNLIPNSFARARPNDNFEVLRPKHARDVRTLFFRNGFLVSPIRLVTNQYLVHALGGVLFNIRVPRADIYSTYSMR